VNARAPTRPSDPAIKRLFTVSGNRCAFPKCKAEIVHGATIVGKICHIKAANPGGPRYDANQSATERHDFGNLILLCGKHHDVIDDDEESYTVERLTKMKADHEASATTLSPDEVDRGVRLLVDQTTTTIYQSGGITAHTVHQTFNLHPPNNASRVEERQAMLARARSFRDERVQKISARTTAAQMMDGGILALHIIPMGETEPSFDKIASDPNRFSPIGDRWTRDHRIDFDGLLTGSNNEGLSKPQRAYTEVFRSGAVEAVAKVVGLDHGSLVVPQIQATIIAAITKFAKALRQVEAELPRFVSVNLSGVQGKRLLQQFIPHGAIPEDIPGNTLEKSGPLQLGEHTFDKWPADYREVAKALRGAVLNPLANASGLATAPDFDADGTYTPALT